MSARKNTDSARTVVITDSDDPEEHGIDSDLIECIECIDEAVGEFDVHIVMNACISTYLTLSVCSNISAEDFEVSIKSISDSYRFAIEQRLDRMTAKGNA